MTELAAFVVHAKMRTKRILSVVLCWLLCVFSTNAQERIPIVGPFGPNSVSADGRAQLGICIEVSEAQFVGMRLRLEKPPPREEDHLRKMAKCGVGVFICMPTRVLLLMHPDLSLLDLNEWNIDREKATLKISFAAKDGIGAVPGTRYSFVINQDITKIEVCGPIEPQGG